jgi:hypothetical protein
VLYGLAKLGAKMNHMPPNVAVAIYKSLERVMHLMNNQEVANAIYSYKKYLKIYPINSLIFFTV